jgi:hypothetical protein
MKQPAPSIEPLVKEARHFLEVLKERIDELKTRSSVLDESLEEPHFAEYQQFRDVMSGCLTFTIIIQNRIDRINDRDKATGGELGVTLDTLTVEIWAVLLRGALRFFQVISQHDTLPLGTRDVFTRELRTLNDANQVFHNARYAAYIDEALRKRQGTAEKILVEIIERAPSLLDVAQLS